MFLYKLGILLVSQTLAYDQCDSNDKFKQDLINVFDEKYVSMISTSDYKTLKTSYQPGAPFTVVATVALHY